MKIWWLPEDGHIVSYDPAQHSKKVRKFLYWAGSCSLIAGEDCSHKSLHWRARNQGTSLKETDEFAPQQIPDGCGDAINGVVVGWKSQGFGVETPDELRALIQEALRLS